MEGEWRPQTTAPQSCPKEIYELRFPYVVVPKGKSFVPGTAAPPASGCSPQDPSWNQLLCMRLGLGFGYAFQKDWNDGAIKDLSAALDRHLSVA